MLNNSSFTAEATGTTTAIYLTEAEVKLFTLFRQYQYYWEKIFTSDISRAILNFSPDSHEIKSIRLEKTISEKINIKK